jgi:hypothetical protein
VLTRRPGMIWSLTEWHNLLFASETRTWEDGMRARSGSLCSASIRGYWAWSILAAAAAGFLFLGNAAWAQDQASGDPNAPALRLINIIPINGTHGAPNTKMFSFDISFVDQATGLYYLADRSNAALDVIDTTGNNKGICGTTDTGPDTLCGQIGGSGVGFAGDTGTTATSGPNGVAASGNCIFAGDGPSRVVSFNSSVSFTTVVSSVSTGGMFRADEMAFDPKDRLLLAINNADTPAFGTLLSVSANCGLSIVAKIVYTAQGVNATGGAEQPVWDPGTQKFYQSIPQIGSNPQNGGVVRINTSGGIEKFYPINFCAPSGLTLGPNEDLLAECAVFTTSGNSCSTVNVGAVSTSSTATVAATAATLQSLGAIIPPVCNGIAFPQVAVCNVTPGRDCTGNALVSVPGVGGGDEVWFNSGDGNYYITAGNLPAAPALGVVQSVTNTLTQLIPSVYAQLQQGVAGTSSFVHSSGTVHSIAASAANNHVYVPLPANNAYQINGINCTQGCIAVFSAQ